MRGKGPLRIFLKLLINPSCYQKALKKDEQIVSGNYIVAGRSVYRKTPASRSPYCPSRGQVVRSAEGLLLGDLKIVVDRYGIDFCQSQDVSS